MNDLIFIGLVAIVGGFAWTIAAYLLHLIRKSLR